MRVVSRVAVGDKTAEIKWPDGHVASIPANYLERLECGCERLVAVPERRDYLAKHVRVYAARDYRVHIRPDRRLCRVHGPMVARDRSLYLARMRKFNKHLRARAEALGLAYPNA